ncbi:unnamed protein product [Sympodiomycopsis kandeliae]
MGSQFESDKSPEGIKHESPHTPRKAFTRSTSTHGKSRNPSLSLQRTHSRKDIYDADTSRDDGQFGYQGTGGGEGLYRLTSQDTRRNQHNTAQHQQASATSGLAAYENEDAKEREEEVEAVEAARYGGPGSRPTNANKTSTSLSEVPSDPGSLATSTSETPANDLEKGLETDPKEKEKASSELERRHDPNLVSWDSPDSQENPRNWSPGKKWRTTFLVSSYTFFSPLSSSMIAPALPLMSSDFHITSQVASNLMLSVFVLAYAVGPLLLGPLSEMFGRRPILQGCNVFFILWTVGCALAQNQAEMTAFRFLAGLGASAPLVVGGGTIGDCYEPQQRGGAMAVYSMAPLIGPVIGPIVGAAITQTLQNWRWIYGVAAIASAAPAVLGVFFLQETYAPRILAVKAARLRKETGNEKLHTAFDIEAPRWQDRFKHNLVRPFVLLLTQPIVQLLAAYMSVIYGTMYLLLVSFEEVFRLQYNFNTLIASLNYISLGIGFAIGGQIGGRLVDRIYRRLKARNDNVGTPEMKLPLMMVSAFLVPIGLILFGFSAQYKLHWIVPNIGAAIFGLGMMGTFLCLQNYTVDTYNVYAASALSAVGFCRSLCGFGLPLAAPSLYANLGYDYGNLLLAGIAAVLGCPAPFLFYKYGKWLREKSPYAASPSM